MAVGTHPQEDGSFDDLTPLAVVRRHVLPPLEAFALVDGFTLCDLLRHSLSLQPEVTHASAYGLRHEALRQVPLCGAVLYVSGRRSPSLRLRATYPCPT